MKRSRNSIFCEWISHIGVFFSNNLRGNAYSAFEEPIRDNCPITMGLMYDFRIRIYIYMGYLNNVLYVLLLCDKNYSSYFFDFY